MLDDCIETIVLIIILIIIFSFMLKFFDEEIDELKEKFKKTPRRRKIKKISFYVFIILIAISFILIIMNFSDEIYNIFTDEDSENSIALSPNELLKIRTKNLAQDIIDFINERQQNDPIYNWSVPQLEILTYSSETINLYFKNFASEVRYCYNELKERGIVDSKLEGYLEVPPNNYISMRDVSDRLGTLGEQIEIIS